MTTGAAVSGRDPEDLLIRARRGTLSEAERGAFEQALLTSAHLRIAYQVGLDVDQELQVRLGDHELISRAAARALLRPRRSLRRTLLASGVAAALLVAGAAAAMLGWGEHAAKPRSSARPGEPSHARPLRAAAPPALPAPTSSNSAGPTARELARVRSAQLSLHGSSVSALPVTTASSAPVASAAAASLFSAASNARRAGELERARRLFSDLQATFPRSEEARVSRVSLGKLLLETGAARAAAQQFADYLAFGGGPLQEEALVGRADALARLGAREDERRIWEQLLLAHPASLYAARAKQRLRTLSASDGSTSE